MKEFINGDCMIGMKDTPDNFYDLAICDPPYGLNINHSIGRRKGQKKSNHKKVKWDSLIPSAEYFKELFRISKDQIIWGGNYMTDYLYPSPCWLLWDKKFSEEITFAQYEMAWSSFTSSAKKFDYSPARVERIHPTQKPIQLYKWLLKNYAEPHFKILDTHVGSASSLIAFEDFGCEYVGYELDKDYYTAAKQRLKNHKAQLTIF